jgi:hypothetical protein
MLDRPPATADRKRARRRRYNRRQANGLVVLRIECCEHDLAEALMSSGRLSPEQALQRGELEHAVAELIGDFVIRWGRVPFHER